MNKYDSATNVLSSVCVNVDDMDCVNMPHKYCILQYGQYYAANYKL